VPDIASPATQAPEDTFSAYRVGSRNPRPGRDRHSGEAEETPDQHEDGSRADSCDEAAAHGWADDPCKIHVHGAERRRLHQLVPRHELRLDRLPCRPEESRAASDQEGDTQHDSGAASTQGDGEGERHAQDEHSQLDDDEEPAAVEHVDEDACGCGKQDQRQCARSLHQRDEEGRSRGVQHHPLSHDDVHPHAEVARRLGSPESSEDLRSKRRPGTAHSRRCLTEHNDSVASWRLAVSTAAAGLGLVPSRTSSGSAIGR
jgi:hypothetical protein